MKQKLAFIYLFTLIFIIALAVGLGVLFMRIAEPFVAYIISVGLVIILTAVIFSNTRVINYLEKLKKSK